MRQKLFCNFCGKRLAFRVLEGRQRQHCEGCGETYYENPLPVASVIVSNRDREILLVKRAKEPYQGMWCLPVGFAEVGESIEDAALRELREETGVQGKIAQLVDVDSHTNPVYGELLIVTFEAENVGGVHAAGDDASECRYFPTMSLPKLAFDSQEKAVQKYVELKRDLWSIRDSFETFVESAFRDRVGHAEDLLSDVLVQAVEENSEKIVGLWLDDIKTNPSTKSYHGLNREELAARATYIMSQFKSWLKGEKSESELKAFYHDLGKRRRQDTVQPEDLVSSLSLLKKHVWMFTHSFGVWERAVDIYRMFELGERLVYFFDRAAYYTVQGYRSLPDENPASRE
ncbi:MAG TPA: NUDIX hydrolase [Syntrophorhabdaceae bacterium]|nr:NUDIX hydrolase [Syntrophorhabdaceae bacterium]